MTTGDSARDVDVPASPLVSDSPLPFPELCARIHGRITAFLGEKNVSARVKSVQEQTAMSLGVIAEALDKYTYAVLLRLRKDIGKLTGAQQSAGALPCVQRRQGLPRPLNPISMRPP